MGEKIMLERSNPKPLYAQLEEIIRRRIENEEWKPNHVIPSENELSKIYGLSRMTVRSVVTNLVWEGLLYRVAGKGTFVSEPKITTKSLSYAGIREQLEQMGYQITTIVLTAKKTTATDMVTKKLEIDEKTPIYIIERLRLIKNEPLSIHTSFIPVHLSKGLDEKDLKEEQLCVILNRDYGLKRSKVVETLESFRATSFESKLLSVKNGYPLLLLEDILYDVGEHPFEYSRVRFRGDKIKLKFEFE